MTFQPSSPVPPADDVTAGWWDATREHRYVLQACAACAHVQHPPRALCTSCYSMEQLDFVPASGHGSVDTFTVVHRGPRPEIEVPYVVARVRLDEGPIVLTRLLGDESWTIGDRVSVHWADLDDGRALPVFRAAVPGVAE
jgi:uncharacterized OB-fold protein